jgi:NADH-quinone oxidoreductase subunit F
MRFDLEGNLQVETVAGSDFVLDADTVIFAVGQGIKPLRNWNDVQLTVRGTIVVADGETMETGCSGVFAGGDAVSGPASVIEAIKAGRTAARAMDIYLGGQGALDDEIPSEDNGFWLGSDGEFHSMTGSCRKLLSTEQRTGFEVVELGLEEEEAKLEAARCLRCDLRVKVIDKLPLKMRESRQ